MTRAPLPCRICGRPVESKPKGRPRECHGACTEFAHHLDRLVALMDEINPLGAQRALLVRRALFGLANEFPSKWERPRDRLGRFAPKA